jgi:hypothetical protein
MARTRSAVVAAAPAEPVIESTRVASPARIGSPGAAAAAPRMRARAFAWLGSLRRWLRGCRRPLPSSALRPERARGSDRPALHHQSRATETRQHHCHKPGQVTRARGGRASGAHFSADCRSATHPHRTATQWGPERPSPTGAVSAACYIVGDPSEVLRLSQPEA